MKIDGLETREMRDPKSGESLLAVRFYADEARPPFPAFLERTVDGREVRFRLNGAVIVRDGDWIVQRPDGTVYLRTPQTFDAVAADHPDNAGTDGFAPVPAGPGSNYAKQAETAAATMPSIAKSMKDQLKERFPGAKITKIGDETLVEIDVDVYAASRLAGWRRWAAAMAGLDQSKTTACGDPDASLRSAVEDSVKRGSMLDKDLSDVLRALEALCDPLGRLGAAVNAGPERDELERAMRKAGIGQPKIRSGSVRLFMRIRDRDFLLFSDGKGWHSCRSGAKRMPYRRAVENRILSDFLVGGKCPTGWMELGAGAAEAEAARLKESR